MDALDPALVAQFPNLGMTPAELLKQEQLRDLGAGQKAFSRTVYRDSCVQLGRLDVIPPPHLL